MKISFNDTSRIFEQHKHELLEAMTQVAKSGWWLQGQAVNHFAESFAHYCGAEYCVPVANGTDALEIALRAVSMDVDDLASAEVINVANAGGYTTIACRLLGVTIMPI